MVMTAKMYKKYEGEEENEDDDKDEDFDDDKYY